MSGGFWLIKCGGVELDKIHCIGIIGQIEGHYALPDGQKATDTGSVIDGSEAVGCGLIDAVGGLSDTLECLNKMIEEK